MGYLEDRRNRKSGIAPPLPTRKEQKPLRKVSAKKQAEIEAEKEARNGQPTELQQWYEKIMRKEKPVCWETGEKINTEDRFGWHGSVAHILPKEEYQSVATHPWNYMILKMWGGTHGQYDSNWENASKMKVWKYAIGVIKKHLYLCLTQEEKAKLPDVILQEIDPLKPLTINL